MKDRKLVVPGLIVEEIEKIATRHNKTTEQVVRAFFKIGLLLEKVNETGEAEVLIHDDKGYRKLVLFDKEEE